MIDFKNPSFLKMKKTNSVDFMDMIAPLLATGEQILSVYKTVRDGVVFTNKRVIAVNIQGITGKKKDFTSLPYSKIQAYSVETAGHFDLDAELDLWFSGLGNVRFEFTAGSDIVGICRAISEFVL